tara:strand:+ start:2615 stop:2869 length:255 start_codon:yes stop_codon:yes gene_type:complete
MDAADLKIEFQKQVKDADVKIAEAEKNLVQLKEYKTKLLGGLETLELLNPKSEETQGGVPEPSTAPQIPVSSQENGSEEPSTES